MYDFGVIKIGDYTFLYFGGSSVTKTRSAHGIALCSGKQASKSWRDGGSTWEPAIVSSLLVYNIIQFVTIIVVYSPIRDKYT